MRLLRAGLIPLALLALSAPAHAAWHTATFPTTGEAPRAAVAADGTAAAVFSTRAGVAATLTGPAGRGLRRAPTKLPVGSLDDERAVAAAPGGHALVALDGAHGLWVLALRPGRKPVATRITAAKSELPELALAHDPAGGWVLIASHFVKPRTTHSLSHDELVAYELDESGALVGAGQDLGSGEIGDTRPTSPLIVDGAGTARLAYQPSQTDPDDDDAPRLQLAVRQHGQPWGTPTVLGDADQAEPRLAQAPDGSFAVGLLEVASCGDSGCSGTPELLTGGVDGTLAGAQLAPPDPQPARTLEPSVATTGSRIALSWLTKTKSSAFRREAPVTAAIASGGQLGPVQQLTTANATEPVALAVGSKLLVTWAGRKGVGVAEAGSDNTFKTIRGPGGAPPGPYHFADTNRDARSAGAWAVLAWSAKGHVQLSLQRF